MMFDGDFAGARRLWADVAECERVTEAVLLARQGHPGCRAAVKYAPWSGDTGLWQPCGMSPAPGYAFCYLHGGPKRGSERRQQECLADA
jgi:hypothetical protein